jgi:U3 small nucleolar RNA-associated protein 25
VYAARLNSNYSRVHLSTFIGPYHQVCIVLVIKSRTLTPAIRKRRRVLKNNERLAHAAKAGTPAPEDVQDQGFTRPSVLILLPFRSSGLRWLESLISHTPPPAFQIENITRFRKEFGLPEGAADKFASTEPDAYPPDHVETFEGNPDDNFRVGLKLTRKSVRLFTEFYGSDIIIASPLGLRMSIEKEKYVVYPYLNIVTSSCFKELRLSVLHRDPRS